MQSVPYFRGVFMSDSLPSKPFKIESGIVNLDSSYGPGTHWVAYFKYKNDIEYFDSFGNLKPSRFIINYLGLNIKYNHDCFQKFTEINCGHLCINFICKKMLKKFFFNK